MYQVICFSVHNKEIASVNYFQTKEEAVLFVEKDSQNTYNENVDACGVNKENMSYTISDNGNAFVSDSEQEWVWEIIELVSGTDDIVRQKLRKIFDNSVTNGTEWWRDDFETDVQLQTKEDLQNLTKEELEIAKKDWVCFAVDGFFECVLAELLETDDEYHEEIYNIVKDELYRLLV